MSVPDKLTSGEVAPHGWVELKTSGAGLPTVLYSEGKAYIPAKREPRAREGLASDREYRRLRQVLEDAISYISPLCQEAIMANPVESGVPHLSAYLNARALGIGADRSASRD